MSPLLRPTLLALCLGLSCTAMLHAEEPASEEKPASAAASGEAAAPAQPATPAAAPREPLPERSSEDAAGLERQLPASEQQQLQAGDEHFLALWKPANAAESRGVIILVPGANESADWPSVIGPLRLKLPDSAWSTLSLSLPDSAPPPMPEAVLPRPIVAVSASTETPAAPPVEPASEPAAETPAGTDASGAAATPPATDTAATVPVVVDPSVRIFARLQAGLDYADQQGAKRVVLLGHGDGAYWAARFLAEQKPANLEHLLSIAAHQPEGSAPPLEELLPGLKLATGDFFYKDQPDDRSAAVKRLQASKRLAHPSYLQLALKALPGNQDAEQEQLYRRVRGWLDKQLPAKE
ncbi:hypothetical protein A9179_19500 [Pseudomonas alcaligenes]|uniref:DUF3530 family protein n=1 Tax=Aquipseudomonas alcaligenes TaxID=43263 RepID=A0ABR7S4F9_AQUAC|nr:alpha/beta hydrolase family protein [Pseudomonas alcaligenes]MBC9252456.1 hypothetical protein [Pseudomonas alcaligenes]